MPGTARLDAPGVLHHVIIRGIEGKEIFRNNKDRDDFIERLETLCPEMQISCYAWALMSNHAHFLFRTGQKPLSTLMRRLFTGYDISFNKRHRRQGYDLDRIAERVAEVLDMDKDEVYSKGRQAGKVNAGSLLCFRASRELGIPHTVLAKKLELGKGNISVSVERSEMIAKAGNYLLEH